MATTQNIENITQEEPYANLDIKGFIDEQFDILRGGVCDVKHTSQTLKSLGFGSCANVRYSEFILSFEGRQDLVKKYSEKYESCIFLPWAALQKVVTSLDLRVDRADRYIGGVPEGQLPYIQIFELEKQDEASMEDFVEALKIRSFEDPDHITHDRIGTNTNSGYMLDPSFRSRVLPVLSNPDNIVKYIEALNEYRANMANMADDPSFDFNSYLSRDEAREKHNKLSLIRKSSEGRVFENIVNEVYRTDFIQNYYVVAPPTAFNSGCSWAHRAKSKIATTVIDEIIENIPPNDPLVIKPCKGGVLVVAAWGDEAGELNELVNNLNL